jgi:hypothetical protein
MDVVQSLRAIVGNDGVLDAQETATGVVCLTLSLPAKRGRGTARRAVEGASAKRFARPSAAFHRDRIK